MIKPETMTRKEQIINLLYTNKVIGEIDLMELLERAGYKDYAIMSIINRIADDILALPIEVPSEDEIKETIWEETEVSLSQKDIEDNTASYAMYLEIIRWVKWMKEEIIKRNQK